MAVETTKSIQEEKIGTSSSFDKSNVDKTPVKENLFQNGKANLNAEQRQQQTKNKRNNRKKKKKQQEGMKANVKTDLQDQTKLSEPVADKDNEDVDIEYVLPPLDIPNEPYFEEFSKVFAHFQVQKEETESQAATLQTEEESTETTKPQENYTINSINNVTKALLDSDNEVDQSEEEENNKEKVSKKKLRKLNRLSVAQLKQLVKRPEVVEWVDVTAADPKLLVSLKAYRNTVPVPQHWSQKRKYLQGKRGIEKPAFELPDFIKDTGIMEMREAVKEKEDAAKLKQKTRERVQPKMGKLDIDYHKLHDAFFRFQAKPKLTIHGELYYEGKEFETKLKEKKPGQLSEELKAALNMPPLAPPPWLIAMQRYGPPPSYPNLKIPGLNSPIPEGAQWGFHPGGWGKPPVDEYNRPLYGDVFGTYQQEIPLEMVQPIERKLWGELEVEEEAKTLQEGLVTPSGLASVANGLETPAYIELRKFQNAPQAAAPTAAASLESGLQTPSVIELRKYQRVEEDEPKALFTVLPQKEASISGFMGSQHVYDLAAAGVTTTKSKKRKLVGTGVDVALDPSEMANLDEETLRAKFEEAQQEHQPEGAHEDFSDMLAEHANKQAKKRQKLADAKAAARDAGAASGSNQKKHKEFKF
ncbi:6863_t:CDS:10 [Ambispora leptoticha]|uniref:6863_t:CDS:1 n=1 Tax=Ambispora leptoticha TaxID=144679 RepID=A0A9N8YUZ6_9GLOM|nr:6863_t:CDS:10 [Ambispora leptoticha]